jgi:hypothetical protein
MSADFFFISFLAVGAYLLPTVIAAARGHNSAGLLFCFNLGCGWMIWGYGVALVWAIAGQTRAEAQAGSEVEPVVFMPDDGPDDPDGGERTPRPASRRASRVRRYPRGMPVRIEAADRFLKRRSGEG